MPPILSSLLNSIKSGAVLAIIAGSLGLVALTAIELGSRDVQATVVGHEEEITRGTKVFRYKFKIDGTDSIVMARQTSNIAGHPVGATVRLSLDADAVTASTVESRLPYFLIAAFITLLGAGGLFCVTRLEKLAKSTQRTGSAE